MRDKVSFRKAKASDFDAVLDLASQLANSIGEQAPPLTPDQFETYYLNSGAPMHLLLAFHDGRVVGMISWTLMHELYSAHARVYISDVAVDRTARRMGIGTALMAEVNAWARLHNASKLGWEVWQHNLGGKVFYENLGASINEEAIPYVLALNDEATSLGTSHQSNGISIEEA